jgi:hypothetical protein
MTRKIDVDNLDADDVQYMRQRPWLIDEAKLQGVTDIEDRMTDVDKKDEPEEPDVTGPPDYTKKGLPELRSLAESRGLDKTGGKAKIIERLQIADAPAATVSREAEGAAEIARTGDPEANPDADNDDENAE